MRALPSTTRQVSLCPGGNTLVKNWWIGLRICSTLSMSRYRLSREKPWTDVWKTICLYIWTTHNRQWSKYYQSYNCRWIGKLAETFWICSGESMDFPPIKFGWNGSCFIISILPCTHDLNCVRLHAHFYLFFFCSTVFSLRIFFLCILSRNLDKAWERER